MKNLKSFAKIFNIPLFGQVLASVGRDVDGNPELRWAVSPPDLGVCELVFGFTDDEIGWDKAEEAFESSDEEAAVAAASAFFSILESAKYEQAGQPAGYQESVKVPKSIEKKETVTSADSTARMDITDMLDLESMSPIEGLDEIYKHYATTFGRTPDAFMQTVVGETKRRLMMWFGSHRETIRTALVLQESTPTTPPAKPALNDGEIANVVNALRDLALQWRDTEQLRERIAQVVVPLLKVAPPVPATVQIAPKIKIKGQKAPAPTKSKGSKGSK